MKNILLMLILTAIFSNQVYAGNQLVPDRKITAIWSGYSDGIIQFTTDGTIINPAGCSDAGGYIFDTLNSDPKSALGVLLSAQAQAKPVIFVVDGGGCYKNSGIRVLRVGITQ